MKCTVCGLPTSTLDTRKVAEGQVIRRRRACSNGHRFSTHEHPSPVAIVSVTTKISKSVYKRVEKLGKWDAVATELLDRFLPVLEKERELRRKKKRFLSPAPELEVNRNAEQDP